MKYPFPLVILMWVYLLLNVDNKYTRRTSQALYAISGRYGIYMLAINKAYFSKRGLYDLVK